MNLLDGFKKLIGGAGEAAQKATQMVNPVNNPVFRATADAMYRAPLGGRKINQQPIQKAEPVQQRNIRREALINDAGGVNYPQTWHNEQETPGYEVNPYIDPSMNMYQRPTGSLPRDRSQMQAYQPNPLPVYSPDQQISEVMADAIRNPTPNPAGMGEEFYDPYYNILKGRGNLNGPNTQPNPFQQLMRRR